MEEDNKKVQDIRIWVAISNDRNMLMFVNEPKRDEENKKWIGNYYCNSVAYNYLMQMLGDQINQLSFDNEPFFITLEYKQ